MSSSSLKSINVVDLPNKDKLVHFVFYCILTLLWFLSLKSRFSNKSRLRLLVFLFAVTYGLLIELGQILFKWGREGEWLDVAANTSGSAFAILILWIKKSKR